MANKVPGLTHNRTAIPPRDLGGQGEYLYGILEDDSVVNLAGVLDDITTPDSGIAVNVTENGSGAAPIHNFRASTLENRKIHFQVGFDSGLDTLNDLSVVFDLSMMAESRNASDASANGSIGANTTNSSLEMQVAADGAIQSTIVSESKNYIKMPQSGITYLESQGVYEHIGAATANVTTFGVSQIGRTPVFFSRAIWNIDSFDGTGPSQITLDFTKLQTAVLQYTGKNKGDVKFGFLINDTLYFAHIFSMNNTEKSTLSYNLPFTDTFAVEIVPVVARITGLYNTSSGYAFVSTMDTISDPTLAVEQTLNSVVCYTVGADPVEKKLPFVAGNKETYKTVTVPNFPLFSIKCAPTFSGGINRTVFNFDTLKAQAAELNLNSGCYIKIFYNTELVGAGAFVAIPDNSESALLYDISATGIIGGIEIFSAPLMANQTIEVHASDIFKAYRNAFSRNDISSAGFSNETLDQMLTVIASPMVGGNNPTATIDVAANIFGGEVG